jgi:hypothetical protein
MMSSFDSADGRIRQPADDAPRYMEKVFGFEREALKAVSQS